MPSKRAGLAGPHDALQERLAALKAGYAVRLPALLARIEAGWRAAAEAPVRPGALDTFHQGVHQLAGSAGSYGFADISRHASAIDALVGPACRQHRALTAEEAAAVARELAILARLVASSARPPAERR